MSQDAKVVGSTTFAITLNFQGGPEYALRARTNTQFITNSILRRGTVAVETQGWVNFFAQVPPARKSSPCGGVSG